MRISAKTDYALRAAAYLADVACRRVTAAEIAQAQQIPEKFLKTILLELRHAGIVHARRGYKGGYALALPPDAVTLCDVLDAVHSPLIEDRDYGAAFNETVAEVWRSLRSGTREVLAAVTLGDVVRGEVHAPARDHGRLGTIPTDG